VSARNVLYISSSFLLTFTYTPQTCTGASFAAELEHPEQSFGKAMILSVILVATSYIIPLLVALGASDSPQEDWKAGYLTTVAGTVVGPWLAAWTVLAAAVSNLALFLAELSGDAYQVSISLFV
jgi:amino acid transporter